MILRELFVKLGLDVDSASFAEGAAAVEIVKAGLGKLVEFGKDVIEHINGVSEYGTKIKEMSQITGIATDQLQRLGKAAASEGVDIDSFGHSMVILSRTMAAAKAGGEEQQKVFSGIGVKIKQTNGHLRSAGDVFQDLQDHFRMMPDGAEKTALALKLMGRSGAEMIPVLNMSSEEMEKFKKASVMDEKSLAASKEIVQIQRQLTAVTKGLWKDAIGPLLPAIRDLMQRFLEWRKANAEIMKIKLKEYIGYVIKAVQFLGDTFDFLKRNAAAVKVILAGLAVTFLIMQSAGIAAAVATAAAWLVAALPFIAIAVAILGVLLVYDDLMTFIEGGESVIGPWLDSIFGEGYTMEAITSLKKGWEAVVEVVKDAYEWVKKHTEALKTIANIITYLPRKAMAGAQAVSGAIGDTAARVANYAELHAGEGAGTTEGATKLLSSPAQFKEEQRKKYIGMGNEQYFARGGMGPEYIPSAMPSPAAVGGGPGSAPVMNKVNLVVNAAPGMSEQAVAKIVMDKFDEHGVVTGDHLEAAAAASGE